MKKQRWIFLLLLSLVLLVSVYAAERVSEYKKRIPTLGVSAEEASKNGFWITVPSLENRGLSYDINGYTDEESNTIYLILPQDVDLKQVVYYLRDGYDNYVTRMVTDFSKGDLQLGETRITAVASELPVLYIEVNDEYGTIHEVIADQTKQTMCYGEMRIDVSKEQAKQKGWATSYISKEADNDVPCTLSMHGRGNATWSLEEKKPFALKLEKAQDLLGMGKSKKWALLANAEDKTLIRNKVFFQLADNLGIRYSPKTENVTCYLNGQYQGVYALSTKTEVKHDRVNLEYGDFLVNWGGGNPTQVLKVSSNGFWYQDTDLQDYPYVDLIWPEEDPKKLERQEYIQKYIDAVETPDSDEYLEYIDVESFARFYWLQEASMNYDCVARSIYTYYDADTNKLYAGPVWDMDVSLGTNGNKNGVDFSTPTGWKTRNLITELFSHKSFQEAVRRVYFEGGVRETLQQLAVEMDYETSQLFMDGELDTMCWDGYGYQYELEYGDSGYAEHADNVKNFYRTRIAWIDEQMNSEAE